MSVRSSWKENVSHFQEISSRDIVLLDWNYQHFFLKMIISYMLGVNNVD